ncbi:ParA family protein [Aeromonas veronii]|uniref:ParA family protein n=1 Tax=Aeromonas hydrophila TaxID=644 RepID=UPI001C5A908B|nr:ParA family protein [Aeromonas hydrophila]MBW3834677.1 AAA family ATPase [Aeromonas hydrophila]MBW5280307.1 AAA family ATPase [Aeromonas hydrophila]
MQAKLFRSSKVIVIANPKGGVGKTTSTVNLGSIIARKYGCRVCLIDGEKDGSLSNFQFFGNNEPGAIDVFSGFSSDLQKQIPLYRHAYDVIIVDTAGVTPDVGAGFSSSMVGQEKVALAAVANADLLLIPMNPSPIDIRKTEQYVNTVERLMVMRPQLRAAIMLNEVKKTERLTTMSIEELTGRWEHVPLLPETIRDTTIVKQAFGAGLAIDEYEPNHPAAEDYRALTDRVIAVLQDLDGQ